MKIVEATQHVTWVRMTPEEYAEWQERNKILRLFSERVLPALEEQERRRASN